MKKVKAKTNSKETWASWLVVIAVSVILCLEQGMVKSLGVLLPDIIEQFSTYTWVIGWSISFLSGWGCLLGEVVLFCFLTNVVYIGLPVYLDYYFYSTAGLLTFYEKMEKKLLRMIIGGDVTMVRLGNKTNR